MKRLQGVEYHNIKHKLIPVAYSKTSKGNICVYYKGEYKHYLNDQEKLIFNPEGLIEKYS